MDYAELMGAKTPENLPDEIWLIILRMVPLEDRIKNVQYVSKRFLRLCNDPSISKSLHFGSVISVPERTCLKVIGNCKNWITDLSFRGCHWFTGTFYTKLPQLPALKSLNVAECCLTKIQLFKVLSKAQSLKNLSLKMTLSEFTSISRDDDVNQRLDILHIHCVYSEDLGGLGANLNLFRRGLGALISLTKPTQSLSYQIAYMPIPMSIDVTEPLVFPGVSEQTVDLYWCMLLYGKNWETIYKHFNCIGFSDSLLQHNHCCHSDLSKVRFLALLPFAAYPRNLPRNFSYTHIRCPKNMTNLECIIAECPVYKSLEHSTFIQELICENAHPRLKCLYMGRERDVEMQLSPEKFPSSFYSNLTNFQNLVELNVKYQPIDLMELLHSMKHLKLLRCLSIPLNSSIFKNLTVQSVQKSGMRLSKSQRVSRYPSLQSTEFFCDLVKSLPLLKSLEITQSSASMIPPSSTKILDPLCGLSFLEEFKLDGVRLLEMRHLSNLLKKLASLRSLTLNNVGNFSLCEYSNILFNSLRLLPCLTQVKLGHVHLELSSDLLREIQNCKHMEVLILKRTNYIDITADFILKSFMTTASHCKRLHRFGFFCPALSNSASKIVAKLCRDLRRSGRHIALFAGRCGGERPDEFPPSLVDLSSSIVAKHDPYEFFELY